MTNYNSTANYIFNLVVQVLVTAYLTREMLLHGRVGWAVTLILVNLAAIGINLSIWLNVKKGRFSAQKIKQGRLTILVILLVSLLCLAVVSRTARVSPENPTVSAAIGQIVPQSDKTKCISVKRKGNTTFAEAEKGSKELSAIAAGWTFATTIKDDAAEEFWAVLEKTELTPHINAFTLTGAPSSGCCTGWTGQIPMHRCCTSVLLRTGRFGSSGSLSCRSLCPPAGCS